MLARSLQMTVEPSKRNTLSTYRKATAWFVDSVAYCSLLYGHHLSHRQPPLQPGLVYQVVAAEGASRLGVSAERRSSYSASLFHLGTSKPGVKHSSASLCFLTSLYRSFLGSWEASSKTTRVTFHRAKDLVGPRPRPSEAGDDLDPLADDCQGFLEDLSLLWDRLFAQLEFFGGTVWMVMLMWWSEACWKVMFLPGVREVNVLVLEGFWKWFLDSFAGFWWFRMASS